MTKTKQIKKALVSSLTTLVLCFAMLVGSTYAWFSNRASTAVNQIVAGNLDVELQMNDSSGKWVDAAGKTLTFQKVDTDGTATASETEATWGPGSVFSLPALRVVNKGDLALKYKIAVTAYNNTGDASGLASVLDVYMKDTADKVDHTSETGYDATYGRYIGTLAQIIAYQESDGYAHGKLTACKAETMNKCNPTDGCMSGEITLTLKMKTEVGTTVQNASISDIVVTLFATQDNVEYDSNGNTYDSGAEYLAPTQTVSEGTQQNVYVTLTNNQTAAVAAYSLDGDARDGQEPEVFDFDAVCSFRSLDELDETSIYADWNADIVVTADGDLAAESLLIAAYSNLYCDGDWLGWVNEADVDAQEEIRLLHALIDEDYTVSYAELLGNAEKFKCALSDLGEEDTANTGTTVTVELRLYEVEDGVETGEYLTIGTYEHTF